MHKKFKIYRTKILFKVGCQSGRKVVTHNPKSDLTLTTLSKHMHNKFKINQIKFKKGLSCPMLTKIAQLLISYRELSLATFLMSSVRKDEMADFVGNP